MLPETRNRTYSDDTPVVPGDLNDIQDCIIAGKHGELSLFVHPSKFQATGTHYDPSTGAVRAPSAGGPFYPSASLDLPAGTRIKSIQFFYNRNGAGAVLPLLRSMTLATATLNPAMNGVVDSTGSTVESQTLTLNHEMVDGDAYALIFEITDVANRVHGAKVVFDGP